MELGRDDARLNFGRGHAKNSTTNKVFKSVNNEAVLPRRRESRVACNGAGLPPSREPWWRQKIGSERRDKSATTHWEAGLTARSRFAVFPLFFQRKRAPLPRAAIRSEPHAAVKAGRLRGLHFAVNIDALRLRRCHHRRDVLALRSQFLAAPFPRVLIEPFPLGLKLPFRFFPLFLLKHYARDDLRLRRRGRRLGQQIAVLDDHRHHPLRLTRRDLAGGDCGDQGYRGVDEIGTRAHLRQIERDPVAILRSGAIEEEAGRGDIAVERAIDQRLHDRLDLLLDQRLGDERGLVARAPRPARGIAGPAGRERPAALYLRWFCRHSLLPPSSDIRVRIGT